MMRNVKLVFGAQIVFPEYDKPPDIDISEMVPHPI